MTSLTNNYEQHIDPYLMGFTDTLREEHAVDVIRSYLLFVGHGLRPTDNVLMIIAMYLAKYFESNGGMTLDQAFGLSAKQGHGSPIKLRKSMGWKASAYFVIWYRLKAAKENREKLTVIKAIEDLISEFKIPHPKEQTQYFDAETLKSSYKKSGASKFFDAQDELCKKHNRHFYMADQYNQSILALAFLGNQ